MLWKFVCGKVEPGETKEQAPVRECREELAVTISVGEVFMEADHDYPDLNVHLTLFNAAIIEETPQLPEHNDIRWITPAVSRAVKSLTIVTSQCLCGQTAAYSEGDG